MIVKWRERTSSGEEVVHEFEFSGTPRTQEGRWIKERTGWSTKGFLDALDELDADAVIALLCILSAREGRKLSWDAVDVDPGTELELIPTKAEEERVREMLAAQEAEKTGRGSLPHPAGLDLPSNGTGHGGSSNGHLERAVSKVSAGPTQPSSGPASD